MRLLQAFEDRVKEHQTGERRVVIVMRQRGGRTLMFVRKREAEGVALAKEHIAKGAKVYANEASHWDDLEHRPEKWPPAFGKDDAQTRG